MKTSSVLLGLLVFFSVLAYGQVPAPKVGPIKKLIPQTIEIQLADALVSYKGQKVAFDGLMNLSLSHGNVFGLQLFNAKSNEDFEVLNSPHDQSEVIAFTTAEEFYSVKKIKVHFELDYTGERPILRITRLGDGAEEGSKIQMQGKLWYVGAMFPQWISVDPLETDEQYLQHRVESMRHYMQQAGALDPELEVGETAVNSSQRIALNLYAQWAEKLEQAQASKRQ